MTPPIPPTPWHRRASRRVFTNHWLNVDIDDVQLPDGRLYEYTVLRRDQHGAGVLAFDGRGRVLMQREFRYPVDAVIWQLPGGLVDARETPLEAAQRELLEETGCIAAHWRMLGSFWDNPAFEDMVIHLFLATGTTVAGQERPDRSEWLTWEWKDLSWLQEAVLAGQIKDRVVLAALGYIWASGGSSVSRDDDQYRGFHESP